MIDTTCLQCYGCTACSEVCPTKAIQMVENVRGFLFPQINASKCINCGVCEKACPIGKKNGSAYPIRVVGLKDLRNDSRMASASGAAFALISDYIINNGGLICGAVFDDNFVVKHICTNNINERDKMRGSKYVQSNMIGIIGQIKKNLTDGKIVLFTGTPCQVAGVKSIIHDENLFTCDIICHGVGSPLIFGDYIKSIEKRYGKINYFTFRNKAVSWRGCNIEIRTDKGVFKDKPVINSFKHLYYGHYSCRNSCFNCEFASEKRVSDITIGDFWGIESTNPEFDDGKGVSIALINTPKGMNLFEGIKSNCSYFDSSLEKTKQPQLHAPIGFEPLSTKFWAEYQKYGYNHISKTYGEVGFVARLKTRIKKLINH